jgi:CBS domain containing-hemolysin-like protein
MPGHVLLKQFLARRTHLFGVVGERGDVIGVVTLEDVLESLVGEEIVDEVDVVVDMQQLARDRFEHTLRRNQPPGSAGDPQEPPAS